jgi:hypothetical protein
MRLLIFVASVSALAASAVEARSLQIHGVTGCLSEYDLSASVSGEASNGIEKLSGPLNIKHVGLCTHDGPNEILSYLKLEFVNSPALVTATLNFDGHECSYRGYLLESYIGVLTCAGGLSLPVRLWVSGVGEAGPDKVGSDSAAPVGGPRGGLERKPHIERDEAGY